MKKEYQNPQTNVVIATVASIIMGTTYADLDKGGTLGGLSVIGRKLPLIPH